MTWTALADSGIGFTSTLPEGVSISGSTVTGEMSWTPGDQSWTISLDSAAKIRATVQEFDSHGYAKSGAFIFGFPSGITSLVENDGNVDEWARTRLSLSGLPLT